MPQLIVDTFTWQPHEANDLHRWFFQNIESYIKGRTLIISANENSLVSILIEQGLTAHLTTNDQLSLRELSRRYSENASIKSIQKLELSRSDFDSEYERNINKFNTILHLPIANSTSHMERENAKKLLRENGHFITTTRVPIVEFNGLSVDIDQLKDSNRIQLDAHFIGLQRLKIRYFRYINIAPNSLYTGASYYSLVIARKIKSEE